MNQPADFRVFCLYLQKKLCLNFYRNMVSIFDEIFYASSSLKRMSISVITAMQFTVENKHLIKWLCLSKNCGQKCLFKIFLTEDEVLVG